MIEIDAPFHNDPSPPNSEVGKPYFQLWDYEVVEAFFLNETTKQYLELEFGPHGQHLVLLLHGRKNITKHSLDLEYEAQISGERWTAKAKVPKEYFPNNVNKFNAYAISGTGDKRMYKSLSSVPGDEPDFHRLHCFQDFDPSQFECLKVEQNVNSFWK